MLEEQTEQTSDVSAIPEAQSQLEVEGGALEAPPYNPNFKFKHIDSQTGKQVESEFDEWIRPAVKDSKTEENLRKLYAKAYGLDHVSQSREKLRAETETLRSKVGDTDRALNILNKYVAEGDLHSFFEALKIPEDKVLKYALTRVQYRDLPEEQRREIEQNRSTQQRAAHLEEENSRLQQQYNQFAVQTREQELNAKLSDPMVQSVAAEFDSRMGAGAFRQEVINRGASYFQFMKQDVPVDHVVGEMLRILGRTAQPGTSEGRPSAESQPKPVLPNIQGKGTSPAKRVPKNLADLKKLAAQA